MMDEITRRVVGFTTVSLIPFLLVACDQRQSGKSSSDESAARTIPVGKGPDALFLTPDENFLYVANVEDTLLSVIDTRIDSVVESIDCVDFPWGFTRLGRTNFVAVSGWGKRVYVIDFTTHGIVRSKLFDSNLAGITSLPDGSKIFVVAHSTSEVLSIDAATLTVTDEFPTGSGPDGISISKDASKVYVTNTEDGTISIIDIQSGTTRLLTVGGKPELIHHNHDNSLLYISNFISHRVHVLDTSTDMIVHDISNLNGPEGTAMSKSGDVLYVVNFNASTVLLFDAKSYVRQHEEYVVGTKPIGVLSVRNDTKIYISNYGDNTVTAIDL